MDWKLIVLIVTSIVSIGVSLVLTYVTNEYRKWYAQEKGLRREAFLAMEKQQQTALASQEQALRSYMELKEEMLFDSIERLVTNLRFWMPDETMVKPDQEQDEWYASVNAIFEAEKRVREIKEAR